MIAPASSLHTIGYKEAIEDGIRSHFGNRLVVIQVLVSCLPGTVSCVWTDRVGQGAACVGSYFGFVIQLSGSGLPPGLLYKLMEAAARRAVIERIF